MRKHKTMLFLLTASLAVSMALPAFAADRHGYHYHDDYEYEWDEEDEEDGRGYETDFDGEADKARSVERDEAETEWIVSYKLDNEGVSLRNGSVYYHDSDLFEGGPGYESVKPLEGSYEPLAEPSASTLGWNTDSVGKYYVKADFTYPKNQWESIEGSWYYFNDDGYVQTGWIEYNGGLYYCDADGVMLRDTVTPDGYRFDESGKLTALPN